MSLRTRLALFIAVAVAAALLVQGVSGYVVFRQQAYLRLDSELNLYLSQVGRALPRGLLGGSPGGPSQGRPPSRGEPLEFLPRDYVARVRFVRDGEVIVAQDGFPEGAPLERAVKPRAYGAWRVASREVSARPDDRSGDESGNRPRGESESRFGDTEDRLGGGEGDTYIQAALSSRELLSSLERYRRTLFATIVSVSALGALIAFWLSRPALRPLDHLLDTAQRVATSGDLSLRVPPGGGGELGKLSETFNRMLSRLSAFRQRESDFTRSASHELRTPLTSMKLQLSSYREGYADAEETLGVLEGEVERMTRLTEALLTLAREGRTERIGVDVAKLARDAADKAQVTYQGPSQLELSGDPILLHQALLNLLENAKKYAPGAEVAVRLEAPSEMSAPYVILSVSDTGPGMSPDATQRATEAFYRAPGVRVPGSGLGLTVVAQVAAVHGGRLELRPNQPTGLVAALHLPLQHQEV